MPVVGRLKCKDLEKQCTVCTRALLPRAHRGDKEFGFFGKRFQLIGLELAYLNI